MTNAGDRSSGYLSLNAIYGDSQRITAMFYWFIGILLVGLTIGIFISLSAGDAFQALLTGMGIPPSLAAVFLVRRRKFELSATFLALVLILLVTSIATNDLGVHHISVIGYPAILIVASLVTRKRTMVLLTIFTILCVAWLVFGELSGAYTPAHLERSIPEDFFSLSLIIVLTAVMVRLITESLFQANLRLQSELKERMRIQEQFVSSEERYRNYIEQSTEGIWLVAFDEPIPTSLPPEEQVRLIQSRGYIAECNDALAHMYSTSSSREMIGRRLLDLYGGQPSETNFQSTLKLVREGYRSAERLTEEVNALGEKVYFLNNAIGTIKDGHLVGIWGTQRDVTERIQAEESLRRQTHELSFLYQFGLALAAGQDLYSTLRALQEEITKIIRADSFFVAIYDESTDTVSYPLAFDLGVPIDEPPRRLKERPGFTGAVILSGKTLYLPDSMTPEAEEAYQPVDHTRLVLHTFLGVPLVSKERVIGVLSVQSHKVDAYTPDQIQLVENLAVQAALAIDKANLLDQLKYELAERTRAEQVQLASHQIAEAALTQNLPEFYQAVYNIISPLIPAKNFYITLYDTTSDTFSNPFLVDEFDTEWPPYRPGKGLGSYVMRTGKPLMASPEVFAQLESQGEVEIVYRRMIEWLGVPLKTRSGKIIGVMAVQSYSGPPRLNASHMELLMFVSVQVAMAIERMQAEAEREKLIQELTAKNDELERFTYTVSHDLKAPLITIRGFLGYLEEDATSGNRERLKSDIERIASATMKMYTLLDELLLLSRIGRMKNPPVDVPFEEIVREALGMVQGRLRHRRIEVRIAPDLPIVHGDRPRLVEILQNLIDNAAKFVGDQSEPRIEIGQEGFDTDGKPILFVRDNGIGIDPQYHEKIFGLFNKLDAQSEGTGVGLALVKRIIEVHECKIWIESEPGKGSTFYFTLPNESEPVAGT